MAMSRNTAHARRQEVGSFLNEIEGPSSRRGSYISPKTSALSHSRQRYLPG